MATTIGQRILTQTVCHYLTIPEDRAWEVHVLGGTLVLKYLVQGRELDPAWDEAGEKLLRILSAPVGPSHEIGKAN